MVAGQSSELTQLEAQAAAKEGHYRKVRGCYMYISLVLLAILVLYCTTVIA